MNEQKKHFVYLVTNISNGVRYVGVTSTQNPIHRFMCHLRTSRLPKPKMRLHRAIKKYGEASFNFEIIEEHTSRKDVFEAEIRNIREMRLAGHKLYNVALGGNGPGTVSEETRKKISVYWKDLPKTEAQKKKISATLTGKRLSAEHRQKISDGQNTDIVRQLKHKRFFGKKLSVIHKQRIRIGTRLAFENPLLRVKISETSRGASNGRARLTEDIVLELRKLWLDVDKNTRGHLTAFYELLATKHSMNPNTIRLICLRKLWKHLP